jgi:hypothetical protein
VSRFQQQDWPIMELFRDRIQFSLGIDIVSLVAPPAWKIHARLKFMPHVVVSPEKEIVMICWHGVLVTKRCAPTSKVVGKFQL